MPDNDVKMDDKFELIHIGSSLLHELAEGLYPGPEAVLREYIQNAVDAHRLWAIDTGELPLEPIQLVFRTNGISILDYGSGMDEETAKNVKSIAVSPKKIIEDEHNLAGHKGVGIWAGLSFFERMVLETTSAGSNKGYRIVLEFKKINEAINQATDIGTALNPNYSLFRFNEAVDDHYTHITLYNPVKSAEWFLDSEKVQKAIQTICPVNVDNDFVFSEEVTDWYSSKDIDKYDFTIDGDLITKNFANNVESFESFDITVNDRIVASGWHGVSKKGKLNAKDRLIGFRIIKDGFVIGQVNPYSATNLDGFDSISALGNYLDWYVGEIHVVSSDLRANLSRDDFQGSEIKRKFVQSIRKFYLKRAAHGRMLGPYRKNVKALQKFEETLSQIAKFVHARQLNDEEISSLAEIKKALDESIAKGSESIAGKNDNSSAPIKAHKKTKSKAKKLLGVVNNLLKSVPKPVDDNESMEQPEDMSNIFKENEDQGTTQSAATNPKTNSTPKANSATKQGEEKKPEPPKQVKAFTRPLFGSEPVQEDDEENHNTLLSADLILALLEDVLNEELADNPQKINRIITKVSSRMQEVTDNVN